MTECFQSFQVLFKPEVKTTLTIKAPSLLYVNGDAHRLNQLLSNFLSNAAKFTRTGEVELSMEEGQRNLDTNKVEIKFAVRDTGIGISAEALKKLFKPFVQVRQDIMPRRRHIF